MPMRGLTEMTNHMQTRPAIRPITMAPMGPTKPAAGVTPTRPAMAPEMPPSRLGWPRIIHSPNDQAS